MLWLVCVVTCVVLFAYQAIDRVCTYFDRASNVDVQINYVEEMDFPAVTICNYNTFR
jgi:acid-sensing ion channel 5